MIAIDLVGTSRNSGSKTYNINFYKNFFKRNSNKKILVFISKSYLSNLKLINNKNVRFIIRPKYFNNFLIRIIWMQLILPLELKIYKVNTLYSPMNYSPLIIKFLNIKSILYVHTILPWIYFSLSPGNIIKKFVIKKLMEKSIIYSDIVMVPSIYAKNKLIELIKINKLTNSDIFTGLKLKIPTNR